MKLLLSSLLLAATAASAEPVTTPRAGNACSEGSGFEGRSMVLWVTDKTNPDEAPCLARLSYARCDVGRAEDAPVETGEALRYFAGQGVAALYTVSPTGGVSVEVRFAGALGIASGVSYLGTFPWQRAVWRGIGVDKARVYDLNARAHRELGNVFLIPAENLTPAALALCPAGR